MEVVCRSVRILLHAKTLADFGWGPIDSLAGVYTWNIYGADRVCSAVKCELAQFVYQCMKGDEGT